MAIRRIWRDDARAVFDRAAREPLERLAGRGHGFVHVGEQPEAALVTAARRGSVPIASVVSQPSEHLLDDASDEFFVNLHDSGQ